MTARSGRSELDKLINKYLAGKATREEIIFVEKFYGFFDKEPGFTNTITGAEKESLFKELVAGTWARTDKESKIIPIYSKIWLHRVAAAVLLLLVGAGTWYLTRSIGLKENSGTEKVITMDRLPGGNKAELTLDDGSSIILEEAGSGILSQQGNTELIKEENGQVSYHAIGKSITRPYYNKITTPRGGQYRLMLSDGSMAWLNAASSIRYPVSFSGKERRVEISGEVFFEIAKNPEMPFRVISGEMVAEALGTQFDVMAYNDENYVKTTLAEGSVMVSLGARHEIIKPGQQVQIDKAGDMKVNDQVDIEQVVSWKNGRFEFSGTSLDEIMRQISRWYNVDIVIEGDAGKETFSGIVSRQSNMSQVLKIMEQAGIKFVINENQITVSQ